MKKYSTVVGLVISTLLPVAILPVRLSEGQGNDPFNLIGSEIIIGIMSFTAWCVTFYVQLQFELRKWQKIGLSLAVCAILSNLFYYTSNPFFEDYPLTPMREYPLAFATLRLSLRGLLMGLIIVPIAFLLENERQRHEAELSAEKQRMRAAKEQNRLLETAVAERTTTLENTLSSLKKSQSELDNQVYLLSRLVASITHDVSSPLNYVITITKRINQLLERGSSAEAGEYIQELLKALISMSAFMNNLLEFTKTQISRESITLTQVNLSDLIHEKVRLFEGINTQQKNTLSVQIDHELTVYTNDNLLAVILHNLLDNAARYTHSGTISIKMETTDTRRRLFIENAVTTVPEPFLFRSNADDDPPHWQGESGPGENRGIGLILVRNITALLNIHFQTEVRDGMAIAQLIFNDPAHIT